MSAELDRTRARHVEASSRPSAPVPVRRLGAAIGLVTLTVLDLLALEDITTAGAGMPETGFLVVSVPALVTLAYLALRRSPEEGDSLPEDEA